ncbi:MAG: 16S rRNA (guanine(527)-N(7))-methyltransferase RsmG [Bacteroidetes bacterium]|nr:16S rRNA (guanine(527)-N(7))-methyltransferase RsmG [Bacteroidota bacterium]
MTEIPSHNILLNYFPGLTPEQIRQFALLKELYADWNEKINVISRKDIDNLYVNHVLHSMGIAKVISFANGTRVLDVGTGGGFPGIPLAILFPGVQFFLVDSIGKKIKVVEEVASSLGLKNVTAKKIRAEELDEKFDFIVSRAVASLSEFYHWTRPLIKREGFNSFKNGILYLKGGDLEEEIVQLKRKVIVFELKDYFDEEFFETKKVVYFN